MAKDLEQMQRENAALVQPELKRLTDEITTIKEETARYDASAETLGNTVQEIEGKRKAVLDDTAAHVEERALLAAELDKLRGDPARLK